MKYLLGVLLLGWVAITQCKNLYLIYVFNHPGDQAKEQFFNTLHQSLLSTFPDYVERKYNPKSPNVKRFSLAYFNWISQTFNFSYCGLEINYNYGIKTNGEYLLAFFVTKPGSSRTGEVKINITKKETQIIARNDLSDAAFFALIDLIEQRFLEANKGVAYLKKEQFRWIQQQ